MPSNHYMCNLKKTNHQGSIFSITANTILRFIAVLSCQGKSAYICKYVCMYVCIYIYIYIYKMLEFYLREASDRNVFYLQKYFFVNVFMGILRRELVFQYAHDNHFICLEWVFSACSSQNKFLYKKVSNKHYYWISSNHSMFKKILIIADYILKL